MSGTAWGSPVPTPARLMLFLRLRPHVSYGMVGGRCIFLDLRRDRYLALDPSCQRAFDRARTGHPLCPEEPAARQLLSSGLFSASHIAGGVAPVEVSVPTRSLPGAPSSSRPNLATSFVLWAEIARARHALRTIPLERLIDAYRRRRKCLRAKRPARDVERLAQHYMAARLLVPIAPSCLQDSLAMAAWLAKRSCDATMVFGVKRDPFAAHCWLQADGWILTDAADRAAAFVPVLAV